MSKARTLANLISDNAELADGQISVAEVVGAAPLASPTFTGTVTTDAVTMNGYLTVNGGGVDVNTVIYPNGIAMEDSRAISFGTGADFELSSGGTFLDHNLKDNARHLRIINGLTEHHRFSGDGNVIFNNSGADADFRIESDGKTHMMFVDASTNRVGINESAPAYTFDVGESTAGNLVATRLHNKDTTSGSGVALRFENSAFSGVNEGEIRYTNNGTNNNNNMSFHGEIAGVNGMVQLGAFEGGGGQWVTQRGAVFNESGINTDFRIESDSNANAFLIDAGNNLAAFAVPTSLYDGSAGNSPSLIFGGETEAGPQKSIYLDTYYMVHQIHVNEGLKFRFTSGTTASFDDRHLIKNGEIVFNETSQDSDFRVETNSINDAFVIDAAQDVIKFKTNVWQHAPLTGTFAGGWVTVIDLDTLPNLISNSAAKIRVLSNENGRTNVSYSEHIAVRTNSTWVLQQLGEVTSGNSHGNANLQMSGTNLQIKNAASSSIGAWKVSLELFR